MIYVCRQRIKMCVFFRFSGLVGDSVIFQDVFLTFTCFLLIKGHIENPDPEG